MRLAVVFRLVARRKFDAASDWYERCRRGRGAHFTAAVHKVLEHARTQPDFYGQVYGDVRQALVPGYPYCVYFRAEQEQLVVFAVFHTARDPALWQARV
jgi:plasmid stabilization system protein ParE